MTLERARRFARAYLDEFGHLGEFEMSLPSEFELEMVSAVFVKELDCTVTWKNETGTITVQMPWMRFLTPEASGGAGVSAPTLH